MKKSKILSMILALTMMLVMVLPMTVSAADENAKITVSGPDSLVLSASGFTAYKLFDVTSSGGNYAYTPVQPAVDNFLIWATANYAPGTSPYGATADAFKAFLEGVPGAAELKALTEDLLGFGGFPASGTVAGIDDQTVEITGLDYGYYLVVGKGTADGDVEVVAHNALVTVDKANCPITLKADAPEIHKFVSDTEPVGDGKQTDVNIGDTVYFKLTSNVPNMVGYTSYTFNVHDTLSDGLSIASDFAENGVTITIDGEDFDDFTTEVSGQSFTIFFGSSFLGKAVNAPIVITYSALLNNDAVIAPESNPNTVYLQYSNNPHEGGTGDSVEDKVDVYTFDLDIVKIDGKTGDALTGAIFELRKTSGDTNSAMKFSLVTSGDSTNPAVYIVDPMGITELETPESGLIYIKGLDAGTYYLYEKEAPEGYNKLNTEETVEISHTVTDGVSDYVTEEVEVENNSGTQFPGTGGIGTNIFYITGAILTAGAVIFLLIRRRRNVLDGK